MSGSFIDTNVIVYRAIDDVTKSGPARLLVAAGAHISVQVLNEFGRVARGKLGWSWLEVATYLSFVRAMVEVHPLTVEIHDLGLELAERHQFHIYDAMIVAAALEADCDTLYTEDMHPGLRVDDRLTIVNPFA